MSSFLTLTDTTYTASAKSSLLSSSASSISVVASNSSSGSTGTAQSTSQSSADSLTLSDASKAALAASQSTVTDPFAGKTQAQLQAIRSEVMQELSLSGGVAELAQNALQLPVPATPERLASAKMATTLVNNSGLTENPFANLSRSALTAIIYDQSGTYTINERTAALEQQDNNDTAFLTSANNQSDATGNLSYIYTALQELNQQQLPVEKATPTEYLSLVTSPEQLNSLVALYGGPSDLLLDYSGGWTPSS